MSVNSRIDVLRRALGSGWQLSNRGFYGWMDYTLWKGPQLYCSANSEDGLLDSFVQRTACLYGRPTAVAKYFAVPALLRCGSAEELSLKLAVCDIA